MSPDVLLDLADGRVTGTEPLVRGLRQAIRAGRLPPGSRLPPTREFATTLLVARSTVTGAYGRLVAEGLLEARPGSGTWVREPPAGGRHAGAGGSATLPASTDLGPGFALFPGVPDLRGFPRSAWLKALQGALASASHWDLSYPEPGGHEQARAVLLEYLARMRGARTSVAHLSLTTGTRSGTFAIATALRRAGHLRVAVEDPGWDGLRAVLEAAGLGVVGIPVDDSGLVVDRLAELPDVRAVLVAPAHHYPLGVRMTRGRRRELLAWAGRHDGLVLEDDYDSEFRYDGRPVGCLQAEDPERVFLIGTVSKTLSPAVGLGWIASPPRWTETVRATFGLGHEPSALTQLAWARFATDGAYDRHLHAARRRYRARRAKLISALDEALPGHRISGTSAGLHLVLHLGDAAGAAATTAEASRLGLNLVDPRPLRVDPRALRVDPAANPPDESYLVLGYGNCGDGEVARSVALLASAVKAAS